MSETEESRNFRTIQLQILARQWGLGENTEEVENRLRVNGGETPRAIPRTMRNRDGVLIIPLWIDVDGRELDIKPNEHGAPKLNEGRFEEWTYEGVLLDLENAERLRMNIDPLSLEDPDAEQILMENEQEINLNLQSIEQPPFRYSQNNYIQRKQQEWKSEDYLDRTDMQKKVGDDWNNAIIQGSVRHAIEERIRVRREQREQEQREREQREQIKRTQQEVLREIQEKQERKRQRKESIGIECAGNSLMGGPPCNRSNLSGGSRPKRSRRKPKTLKKKIRKSRRR